MNLAADDNPSLLAIERLCVEFAAKAGPLPAVREVSLALRRGEALCIVGESGSGKSTLALAVIGLLADNARVTGRIVFNGGDLLTHTEEQLGEIRGRRIGFIFQDPARALNPVLSIGRQITEVLLRHSTTDKTLALARAEQLLTEVGVNDARLRLRQYPHELSGGIKQRVMIAMAIACEPELLIADEPTTALDVTIQGQVLRLLRRLCNERGVALILVTHDFGVVAAMADRVAVMYAGRVVEYARAVDLFQQPQHPYSQGLLVANPRRVLDADIGTTMLDPIPGSPPSPYDSDVGCSFAPRCAKRHDACTTRPTLRVGANEHLAACWLAAQE
ncbi:MAG: ABC transporter ATP-binding protein [Burkholderiales bacterium]